MGGALAILNVVTSVMGFLGDDPTRAAIKEGFDKTLDKLDEMSGQIDDLGASQTFHTYNANYKEQVI